VRIPILAIGGMTLERLPDVIRAGANGVAVLSAIVGTRDIRQATRAFLHLLGRGQTP
jgi:thiamine-phosphate pyrophosphorylase